MTIEKEMEEKEDVNKFLKKKGKDMDKENIIENENCRQTIGNENGLQTGENPLLTESPYPFGAPQFDKIRNSDYLPAFEEGIREAKAEIDAIAGNPAEPDFSNTIEALEFSGRKLDQVSDIFFNILEADTDDEKQEIAEKVSPMLTEYSMYVSMNEKLFKRVSYVYGMKDSLGLSSDAKKLLEDTYRSFVRNGAALEGADREEFARCVEQLSLLSLQFGKNVLASSNSFSLHVENEADLDGLPQYVRDMGAASAAEKGLVGWVYTLEYPSYSPFMKFSRCRELRRKMYMARSTRAYGGEFGNEGIVGDIVVLRLKKARLLGYKTYAEYALEERMARTPEKVSSFLTDMLVKTLPFARKDVDDVLGYARRNGFEGEVLEPWDFSYWAERYQEAEYSLNEEQLKPYFRLEDCISAVFGLAGRLYGLRFDERKDIPVYHKDVKVYDVTDASGRHMALFYADFFPRPSKRDGAWMTEFRGQSIIDGVERRPFISIVTNFTKPSASAPSLLTHGEFTTFLHEFGHALHGILAEGRYPSLTGTNVERDFVELPSQIMENWACEPEYLDSFAKDYRTGEVIPDELVKRIVRAQNYLAGYQQVRQLQFGILDMAWHTLRDEAGCREAGKSVEEFEKKVLTGSEVLPHAEGTVISTSFGHIFSGGYAAGYYSYKWAEVLEADAFSLFKENGIFDRATAESFRSNILSRGGSEDPDVLYRNFRGRDPQSDALMKKLGLI